MLQQGVKEKHFPALFLFNSGDTDGDPFWDGTTLYITLTDVITFHTSVIKDKNKSLLSIGGGVWGR